MRKILMPDIGGSPGVLTIKRWFKAVGDSLAKGELLAKVEGAEGLIELQAAEPGVLAAIHALAGVSVAPGTPIAEFQDASSVKMETKQEKPVMSSKSTGQVTPILMPQAGNSMEEGTIVKWLVKEGDRISKGQVIFEIETDKANMEVEATDEGRLAKIVAAEGATIAVKQPVAFLAEEGVVVEGVKVEDEGEEKQKSRKVETQKEGEAAAGEVPTAVPVVSESGRVMASPAARKLAAAKGIDLAIVAGGSGPGGRILSTDLANVRAGEGKAAMAPSPVVKVSPAVANLASVTPAAVVVSMPVGPAMATTPKVSPVQPVPAARKASLPTPEGAVRKKMSKMRKAIAANLSISKQTVPHFYLRGTINAEAMMAFYRAEKSKYPCSVNDVVTMACSRAIMEFPAFRSKIDGDEVVEYPNANIGVAVGVDDGLTVPVLLGAQKMSLQQIGANTKRIADNARAGKLEGWGEGNFTISNLGMFGVEEFAAIVNPPEPAILAVGAVREDVIVKDGFIKPGKVMTMTLSCDHRIVDGLLAANFMSRLKELLENPSLMA